MGRQKLVHKMCNYVTFKPSLPKKVIYSCDIKTGIAKNDWMRR